jgi:hypothetical protein
MFKNHIPKGNYTGGGRKGNKESYYAKREKTQSPIGEVGKNKESEQEQE